MTIYRRSKDLGTVIESHNEFGDQTCLDLFQRPDGSFGYEHYRRDVESLEGWFPIGYYSGSVFATLALARRDAATNISWFEDRSGG